SFSSALSSFFFHGYRPHRDLHSFPTRRSSDLGPTPCSRSFTSCPASASEKPLNGTRTVSSSGSPSSNRRSGFNLLQVTAKDSLRSEEHTSELQSRGHLVCRLLLEKKKTDQQQQ